MPSGPPESPQGPPRRTGSLSAQDGLQLYYEDHGDPLAPGVPVLCLAGLTRNSSDFSRVAPRLATQRRVVALDYRGRGRSERDPNWRNYTPEACALDVIQATFALGLHRFVVLGTSFGGLLGMGLAVFLPSALAGVVLNDTGPQLSDSGIDRIMNYVGKDNPQRDWESAAASTRAMFPKLGLRSEEDWDLVVRGTFREGPDGWLHNDWDPAIARAFTKSKSSRDIWPFFRALRPLPALAIRGARSDVLSAAGLRRMAEAKPDLRQVTVEGVGHTPSLDEAECRRALDDFLSEIDRMPQRH